MGCGVCDNINKPVSKNTSDIELVTLTRKSEDVCGNISEKEVFPITYTQAIFDPCTQESLHEILKKYNHIYAKYKGTFLATIKGITDRNKGLVVTYVDRVGDTITKRYVGKTLSDADWFNTDNWKDYYSKDTFYKPTNLRIEDNTLSFDVENEEGEIVDTLSTEIEISSTTTHELKTVVVKSLPTEGDPNKIFLVKHGNGYRKYIWVPQLKRFEPLGDITYNSSVCGIKDSINTFTEKIEIADGTVALTLNNGTVLTADLPESNIPEGLEERLKALEEKDTAPTDTAELEERIKTLEDKADECNCDLSPLEARIATLEGKEDKDTIFNPDALNEAVNSLKSEVAKLKEDLQKEKEKKDKYVVSGRWVDKEDDTSAIILTMSDDTEIEIPVPLYEKPEEEPKPKKFIKFGYHETERIGDYASVNDLSGSIEVDALPKEITFGEDKRDVYGYWIVAINKELAPNTTSGNIYMYANGDYLPMVSGYEVEEAIIEGVEYIIIKDIDIEEISQVSLRFT